MYIIVLQYIYIQYTLFKISGQVRMDGWHRMGLDDDFPIRQALSVRIAGDLVLVLGSLGLFFHIKIHVL